MHGKRASLSTTKSAPFGFVNKDQKVASFGLRTKGTVSTSKCLSSLKSHIFKTIYMRKLSKARQVSRCGKHVKSELLQPLPSAVQSVKVCIPCGWGLTRMRLRSQTVITKQPCSIKKVWKQGPNDGREVSFAAPIKIGVINSNGQLTVAKPARQFSPAMLIFCTSLTVKTMNF